jgi:four helix bundle suffix protein
LATCAEHGDDFRPGWQKSTPRPDRNVFDDQLAANRPEAGRHAGFVPPFCYIKLTNVARASLEELLADYRDFLRVRGIAEWPKDHPYALRLRELNRIPDARYETFRKGIENPDPAICANVIIGLIRVASVLLSSQIQSLEKAFITEGGLRERMTRARLDERDKQRRRTP